MTDILKSFPKVHATASTFRDWVNTHRATIRHALGQSINVKLEKAIREMWADHVAGDMDFETGVYIQDKLEKHGLLREEKYNHEKHGDAAGENEFEEGDTIYFLNFRTPKSKEVQW